MTYSGHPSFEPYTGPGGPPAVHAPAAPGPRPAPGAAWPAPAPDFSALAITGFILSLVPLLSVPAIICCALALPRTGFGRLRGRGLAVAGLVIGSLALLALLAAIAIPVFLAQHQAAVSGVR